MYKDLMQFHYNIKL